LTPGLGGIIVGFELINPRDPDEVDMGRTKGIDSSLEVFVLWGKLGQLLCADLAEAFLCSLDI